MPKFGNNIETNTTGSPILGKIFLKIVCKKRLSHKLRKASFFFNLFGQVVESFFV